MRGLLLTSAAAVIASSLALSAHATTVATIVGAYDKDGYDTPELDITNTSGGTLTGVQMVLYGYQGGTLNDGISQTAALPTWVPGRPT